MIFIKGFKKVWCGYVCCGGFKVKLVTKRSIFNHSNIRGFTSIPLLTFLPLNTLFASIAFVALFTLRTGVTFLPLDTLLTSIAFVALLTLRSSIAFVAFFPLNTLNTLLTGIAFLTLLALWSNITLIPFRTLNTLLSLRSFWALRSGNALFALYALWT